MKVGFLTMVAIAAGAVAIAAIEYGEAGRSHDKLASLATVNATLAAKDNAARSKQDALAMKLAEAQAQAAAARKAAATARAAAAAARQQYNDLLAEVDGNDDGVYDSHPGQVPYPEETQAETPTSSCEALRIIDQDQQTIESSRAYHACLGN